MDKEYKLDDGEVLIRNVKKLERGSLGDDFIDGILTHIAKAAMDEKLRLSRDKGRSGWYRRDCTIATLSAMLIEHLEKGDMVDVMNFAAMIYAKEAMELAESSHLKGSMVSVAAAGESGFDAQGLISPPDAALAAISFSLDDEDGDLFLRYWRDGEFDVIRREWPDAPEEVFIGADPLHGVHNDAVEVVIRSEDRSVDLRDVVGPLAEQSSN